MSVETYDFMEYVVLSLDPDWTDHFIDIEQAYNFYKSGQLEAFNKAYKEAIRETA